MYKPEVTGVVEWRQSCTQYAPVLSAVHGKWLLMIVSSVFAVMMLLQKPILQIRNIIITL